ncbi:MAG: hypothetical protein CMJ64_22075 [Planctomycetaceae bacterium]|nr:hypothetical protein [Planctomycetaceae bacterium]
MILRDSSFANNNAIGLWMKGCDSATLSLEDVTINHNGGYGWLLDKCYVNLDRQQLAKIHLRNNAVAVAALSSTVVIDGARPSRLSHATAT